MDNQVLRSALGHIASLGALYDARTDSFHDQSILKGNVPSVVTSLHEKKNVDVHVGYGESHTEKFKGLNVGPDLAASLLSGLVTPDGIGHHLVQKTESNRTLQASVYHTITTTQEKLELMHPEIRGYINSTPLQTSEVTHMVTEIEYGAQTIVSLNRWLRQDAEKGRETPDFQQQVDAFVRAVQSPGFNSNHTTAKDFDQIIAYSTTLGSEDIVLNDSDEAQRFLELLPLQIKIENSGKGKPILYKLLPIQMLAFLNLLSIEGDAKLNVPSRECMKKFIQLCEEFCISKQPLQVYEMFALKYKFCLPPSHIDDVARRVRDIKAAEQELKGSFGRALQAVRGGTRELELLWQVLQDFSQAPRSPKAISTFTEDYQGKVAFIDSMLTQGVTYIGYNSIDLRAQLAQRGNVDSYIFCFSDSTRKDENTWNANQALMLSLLADRQRTTFFAIVDCDATKTPLPKAVVSHYQNGSLLVEDLYEEQQYLADHCFARYQPQTLESKNVQKPTKRRIVKIPCPGGDCSAGNICDWRCLVCRSPLEYGYSDEYIYCDCGRTLYSNFDFKCNTNTHGPGYDRYNNTNLLNFLKSLDQSDYLNVLILGETGVGKSTFINAFVNYLYFSTLDEALAAEGLQSVIPCHFAIQTMDRSNVNSEIKETVVKVGDRVDEHDGSKGASATQQTQVYPITVGSATYRLIDTPGIGDTRGLEYDKSNMADILATSNNARLTAHFSFCVKELLTHLHRNATHNVVFGFTNTRISNYMPGDTFGSLKALLTERADIGLSLSAKSTYCFDSESFRYLAAFKQGVIMDNKSDFDSSWERSRSEAERMLAYFRTKEPHPIKSTISLNGTRNLVLELTKPMAEISQNIKTNIAVLEDGVRQLQDARLTGDKLRTKLRPEMTFLRHKPLDKHRTVCSEPGCVQFKDDGNGKGKLMTDYPNPCHPVCWLDNVTVDVVAHSGLIGCAAFAGNENCQHCGHHWTSHVHIMYELEAYKKKITDLTVEQQIKQHASDITLKQAAINDRKQLMVEWQQEHEKIQEAAAKFGLWMKANSILPYNDATLAYLDVLIKAEQMKVDAGGSANIEVLTSLQDDARKHKELVAILTESMKDSGRTQPIDQTEIQRIVQSLYKLKHFGKNLEDLKMDIIKSHEMTNRELPHRVKHKYISRSNNILAFISPISSYRQTQPRSQAAPSHSNSQQRAQPPSRPPSYHSQNHQRTATGPGFTSGTMRTEPVRSPTPMKVPGSFYSEVPSKPSYMPRVQQSFAPSNPGADIRPNEYPKKRASLFSFFK